MRTRNTERQDGDGGRGELNYTHEELKFFTTLGYVRTLNFIDILV
jgi:hypothetical protein